MCTICPCWNWVWKGRVPHKMRTFAWKVSVGTLATAACKAKHHISDSETCWLCGDAKDDSFHALITCPGSVLVWHTMRQVWPLPTNDKLINTGPEWLMSLLADRTEKIRAMIIMLLWRIWSVRNDQLHHKATPPLDITKDFFRLIRLTCIRVADPL